jgi:MFS family permease
VSRDARGRGGALPGPDPSAAATGWAFHGWRIVAVLAVTETISWGVLYYAFAVFQVPMGAELGMSSAQLSGAFSLAVLLTGVAGLGVGRWLDLRGPRGLMTVGSAACALLVVAWSRVDTALELYLVMAGIGLARAAVLYEPAFAVIVRWFHTRRSTALLAVTVVAGFASTVALPASNALISAFGWRQALLVLAAALAATTVLPHWLVLRSGPAQVGQHPDGAAGPPAEHTHPDARAGSWLATARWAAAQPVFRWQVVAFAAQAAAVIVVAVHLVPFLREHGHGPGFAAAATGALGALSVTGRLVLTGAVRRAPAAAVTATMFAVQSVGGLVLLVGGSSTAGAVAFVLLFGIGFGAGTIARPALLAESFGTARYATVAGLLAAATTAATTVAPFLAGAVRTATGSYTPVLAGLVVVCAVAAAGLVRAARVGPVARAPGGTSSATAPGGAIMRT